MSGPDPRPQDTDPVTGPATEPAAATPTTEQTAERADEPTTEPTTEPAAEPTSEPTSEPTADQTAEPADEPGERRRRLTAAGLLPVLVLALLSALVVLTAFLAWQLVQDSRTDTARDEALAASRDAARLLFSYDHEQLDDDFEAGLAVTTGQFREQYERTTREVVKPVAEQYDTVVEAEVVEAAVVQAEPDRVVTVVFLNQTTTSTAVEGPRVDQSRVRMGLRKVDGEWRVHRVDAL